MKKHPNGNIDGLIHALNQESLKRDIRSRSRNSSINSSPSSRASTISPGEVNTPTPPMDNIFNNSIRSQSLSPMDLLTTQFNNISTTPFNNTSTTQFNNISTTQFNNISTSTNDTTYDDLCYHLARLFIYLQDITIKSSYNASQFLLITSKNTISIIHNSIKFIILLIFQIIKEETKKIVNTTTFRGMMIIIMAMMATREGRDTLTKAYYMIAHFVNYKEIYGGVASILSSIALIKPFFTGIDTFHLTQQQYNHRLETQVAGMQTQISALQSQNQAMSQLQSQIQEMSVQIQSINDGQLKIHDQIDSNSHIGNLQLDELGFKTNELLALSKSNNQGLMNTYFKIENVDNQVTQLKTQLITLFKITKDNDNKQNKQFDKIIKEQEQIITNISELDFTNNEMLKHMVRSSRDVDQLLNKMKDKTYIKLMTAILQSTNINAKDIVNYLGFFQNYITFTTPNPQIRNEYFSGGKRKTKSRNHKSKIHLKRKKKNHNSRKK